MEKEQNLIQSKKLASIIIVLLVVILAVAAVIGIRLFYHQPTGPSTNSTSTPLATTTRPRIIEETSTIPVASSSPTSTSSTTKPIVKPTPPPPAPTPTPPPPSGTGEWIGTRIAGNVDPLLTFTQQDYEKALKTNKLIVLYFYAIWCTICQAETGAALYPAFNELQTGEVIGFRVNYDDKDTDSNERALARQFGVAYQHTKVFVRNNARLLKSPESWDKNRYLKEINNLVTP